MKSTSYTEGPVEREGCEGNYRVFLNCSVEWVCVVTIRSLSFVCLSEGG